MEDFAKKLIVLILLIAFFGALFLETPLLFKKFRNGDFPALDFLNSSPKQPPKSLNNQNVYPRSSRICVPALDGENC